MHKFHAFSSRLADASRSFGARAGSLMRALGRDDRGNFAIILAISILPIAAAVGGAVDLNRAFIVQQRLERALDAAGLAVGASPGGTTAEMTAMAQSFFDANYDANELGVPGSVSVVPGDGSFVLTANAELPTTILKVIGLDTLSVGSEIEVVRESKALEVAMVLDNTGSMAWNGKIGALRTAAEDLVSILFGDQDRPSLLRMSLVPFVTAVNIKADGFDMQWMDVNGQSRYHGENFDSRRGPTNHFTLFDNIRNAEWKGCVEMRPAPHDTLDTAPTPGNADTLFVPYFWPDESDRERDSSNDYLDDDIGGNDRKRQENSGKYDNARIHNDETPSTTYGPNKSCPRPLVPLTNSRTLLVNEVRAMEPWYNSGTNIAEGLAWGWRVLSPAAPFTEGASYTDPDVQKALILLTDGNNEIVSQRSFNGSDYTSFGYIDKERLGTDSIGGARNIIDDKVGEMCERVKAEGVRVYTITFQLNSPSLQEVFRDCATSPELYFDSPSNSKLREVFQSIAYDLSNLRLAR
ncbi:pilus assembly protein TadG-related protein [Pyruvatibacter mobilis]|uniref:TadE/TadG family type IV pilus assembly protein n=1 Tax=Pyruvatibacter mobilis TaxID=1712261 RepID=UPI003D104889